MTLLPPFFDRWKWKTIRINCCFHSFFFFISTLSKLQIRRKKRRIIARWWCVLAVAVATTCILTAAVTTADAASESELKEEAQLLLEKENLHKSNHSESELLNENVVLDLSWDVFTSISAYQSAWRDSNHDNDNHSSTSSVLPRRSLMLALIHDEACPHSHLLRQRFLDAASLLFTINTNTTTHHSKTIMKDLKFGVLTLQKQLQQPSSEEVDPSTHNNYTQQQQQQQRQRQQQQQRLWMVEDRVPALVFLHLYPDEHESSPSSITSSVSTTTSYSTATVTNSSSDPLNSSTYRSSSALPITSSVSEESSSSTTGSTSESSFSSAESLSLVLLLYTGLQRSSTDIAETAAHYYLRLVWATSGIHVPKPQPSHDHGNHHHHHHHHQEARVSPPVYSSVSEVWRFVLDPHHYPVFRTGTSLPNPHPPLPLPPILSPHIQMYVHALLAEETPFERMIYNNNSNRRSSNKNRYEMRNRLGQEDWAAPDDWKVFIQCRHNDHGAQQPNATSATSSTTNASTPTPNADVILYQLFDHLSHALSSRRDCFFAVVLKRMPQPPLSSESLSEYESESSDSSELFSCKNRNIKDGSVLAFRIPYDYDFHHAWNNQSSEFDSETEFDHYPKTQQHKEDDSNVPEPTMIWSNTSALAHQVTRFATPSVLFFDRQSTAPIVMGTEVKLHALLIIHVAPPSPPLSPPRSEYYSHHHNDSSLENQNDHHPSLSTKRAAESAFPWFSAMRTQVRAFRRACRQSQSRYYYYSSSSQQPPHPQSNSSSQRHRWSDDFSSDQDLACLIVPSTDTRLLYTLFRFDEDEGVFPDFEYDTGNITTTTVTSPWMLTSNNIRMIITDQRIRGKTKVYDFPRNIDFDNANESDNGTDNANSSSLLVSMYFEHMTAFIERVKANAMIPRIKSDARGPRTNRAGVRILTGASFVQEVEVEMEMDIDSTPTPGHTSKLPQSQQHALILLGVSSCGHCKRANVIWNRLAEFFTSLQWNTHVQLYRMDVSENDVPINDIAPKWLPDVYYYDRSRSRPISSAASDSSQNMNEIRTERYETNNNHHRRSYVRFDWMDDDTSAPVMDSPDFSLPVLLEWFVSVAHWTDAELTLLLQTFEGSNNND